MGKVPSVFFVWMLVVIVCFTMINTNHSMGENELEKEQRNYKKEGGASFWEWQRLRDAYSIYSALFTTSVGQYWGLLKTFVNHAYARLFPPNIESGDEGEGVTDNGAAGEKVKEAIAKSLGKSKATVEDTAKSAADMTGETMNKAKEKVKRTLSPSSSEDNNDYINRERERQNEL